MDFKPYRKIPRFYSEITITEKLDGTNACVAIGENGEFITQSRNRIITPADDNEGFSKWANDHRDELIAGLGRGYHYGEWWGHKIQRGYGLGEKRFSLFDAERWAENCPPCCHLVPVLYRGVFSHAAIEAALEDLRTNGSKAVQGFMKPEGIIIHQKELDRSSGEQRKTLSKFTLDGDGHKGGRK